MWCSQPLLGNAASDPICDEKSAAAADELQEVGKFRDAEVRLMP
jgi:hypothetical protein